VVALWIAWRRDGRASRAHRAVAMTHRADALLHRVAPLPLACGRTTPEPMTATLEVAMAGVTAPACRDCTRRTPWTR
jgi:hypothetical protein